MDFFKKLRIVIAILICVVIIGIQYIAFASTNNYSTNATRVKTPTDPRITKLTADLEYATKAEAQELIKYATAKQARIDADAKLSNLNTKIKAAQAAKSKAISDEEAAKAEFADAQIKYDNSIKESKDAKIARDKAVVDLYIQGSDPDLIPSLLDVPLEDRQDVLRKTVMHFKFTEEKINKIVSSAIKAQEAEAEKALHVEAIARAEAAKAEAKKQEDALIPLKADLVAAQADAKAKEANEKTAVDAIKAQKSSYTIQIDKITAESNALAAEIKKKQNQNAAPTPVAPGRMIRPVPDVVTSPFGYRVHPIYGDSRLHAGIDYGSGLGISIKAAKAGKVISATVMSGYGNVIVIDHGGGISTLYAHMNSFSVGIGTVVTQGQVIGYVGQSGNVTGPHLHFEVRVNGVPTDPNAYF